MQRIAEPIARQRLDVILQVRDHTRTVRLREHPELAARHRHRAAAPKRVLQRDAKLPHGGSVGVRVQGPGVANREHGADLQVVLEVLPPHARTFVNNVDVELRQTSGWSTPESSRILGEWMDPAASSTSARASVCRRYPPNAGRPPRGPRCFGQQPLGLGADEHPQVGPLHRRAQEAVGGFPAHPLTLLRDLPAAAGRMHGACGAVVVLGLQKVRKDVVPHHAEPRLPSLHRFAWADHVHRSVSA